MKTYCVGVVVAVCGCAISSGYAQSEVPWSLTFALAHASGLTATPQLGELAPGLDALSSVTMAAVSSDPLGWAPPAAVETQRSALLMTRLGDLGGMSDFAANLGDGYATRSPVVIPVAKAGGGLARIGWMTVAPLVLAALAGVGLAFVRRSS